MRVTLDAGDRSCALVVRDDGVGFDPAGSFPGHLGLASMRERAGLAGADITIDSQPGDGTTVTVRLGKDHR